VFAHSALWKYEQADIFGFYEPLRTRETVLRHVHLPKLREADIVEYDERSRQVAFRNLPAIVECCLEQDPGRDFRA